MGGAAGLVGAEAGGAPPAGADAGGALRSEFATPGFETTGARACLSGSTSGPFWPQAANISAAHNIRTARR